MKKDFAIINISLEAKSNKEVYQLLTFEGSIYLCPILDANKSYIKDMMTEKEFLYWKQIQTVTVPHIDEYKTNHQIC